MKVAGASGEAALKESIYRPLIEVLAEENYAPKTLSQLADHSKLKSLRLSTIFEALLVLVGTNSARPARAVADKSRQCCAALNRYICERARSEDDVQFLASPVTSSGIFVNRIEQLFLLAAQLGKETDSEKAAFVSELVSAQGHAFGTGGKALQTPDEIISELVKDAVRFAEKRLPIFKALGIA